MLLDNSETLETLSQYIGLFAIILGAACALGIMIAGFRFFTSSEDHDSRMQDFKSTAPKTFVGTIIVSALIAGGGKSAFDYLSSNGVLSSLTGNAATDLNPQGDLYQVNQAETFQSQADINRQEIENDRKEQANAIDKAIEELYGKRRQENSSLDTLALIKWCKQNNIDSYDKLHGAYFQGENKKALEDIGIGDIDDPFIKHVMEQQHTYWNSYIYDQDAFYITS